MESTNLGRGANNHSKYRHLFILLSILKDIDLHLLTEKYIKTLFKVTNNALFSKTGFRPMHGKNLFYYFIVETGKTSAENNLYYWTIALNVTNTIFDKVFRFSVENYFLHI